MRVRAIIMVVCMSACISAEQRPKELLDRDKFIEVLLEAQLIEARINQGSVTDKRSDAQDRAYYAEMFKTEGITEEAFKSTFKWYVGRPAELKDIYNDVLARLQQRVDLADSTGIAH